MNVHKKLRQLERRVAALEKSLKPYEVEIAIQAQAIDQRLDRILSRRFSGDEKEDTPCQR